MIRLALGFFIGSVAFCAVPAEHEKSSAYSFSAHDLQDIHEAAELFLKNNGNFGENFFVAPPNPKIVVEQCKVPLEPSWGDSSSKENTKNIRIICRRTASSSQGWRVVLSVTQLQKK